MNAEIATGTVQSFAQAVAFLKWSYFYRRLLKNPSYYGCEPGLGEEKNREEAIEEFMLAMVKEVRGRALSPDIDVHPQLHHGL